MNAKAEPISVEIYGQSYNVRGEGDPAYLTELARFVDSRMQEVASKVNIVDPLKIAILAALNIADELSQTRQRHAGEVGNWLERTEQLIDRLGRVVVEPS